METPVARDRRFSWFTANILIFASALAVIAARSEPQHLVAQSAALPHTQISQPVPAWQKAVGKMEFEVASIRPAAPGAKPRQNFDMSVESLREHSTGRSHFSSRCHRDVYPIRLQAQWVPG